MTPLVSSGTGVDAARRVIGSMKSSGERRTREMRPSSWANLMISACWVSTARMTICCWPLRAVPVPRLGGAFGCPWRGRRREQRADDLEALEQQP